MLGSSLLIPLYMPGDFFRFLVWEFFFMSKVPNFGELCNTKLFKIEYFANNKISLVTQMLLLPLFSFRKHEYTEVPC